MRILAFSRKRLDRFSAGAVHVVQSCAAFARGGAKVVLHADLGGRTQEQILAHHGAEPSPNLTLREMGWRWRGVSFGPVANALVKKEGAEPTVVLLNEIQPHALVIGRAARRQGCRVVFEASGMAGRIAYARAGAPWTEDVMRGGGHDDHGSHHGHEHADGTRHAEEEHGSHAADGHHHEEEGAHSHGSGAGPGPVLTIARSRPAAGGAPQVAAGAAGRPASAVEDPEEAAGRERARFKPDPKAVAAAAEISALEKEILSLADLLIAPQQATIDAARSMLKPGVPAHVVPNGTLLPAPSSGTAKDIDILYLGSLLPWKGVDALVGAMPRLFPYSLTIVGGEDDADRKLLQQMALQIGAASRVRFLPPVAPSQVWGLYARAKVGVAPLSGAFLEAREYAFPQKLLELMAAGVPVVTARIPSIQAIVHDGIDVLMADSDDPDDYGIYIRRLLEDGALAAHLASNARKKAENLTYAKRAARLMEAFGASAR